MKWYDTETNDWLDLSKAHRIYIEDESGIEEGPYSVKASIGTEDFELDSTDTFEEAAEILGEIMMWVSTKDE